MEKQNQFVSMMALLPGGKVENDVKITDNTVTGICTVYLNRDDGENAFFLRDIGVALIGEDLTAAARCAVDQAYEAVVSHLAAVMPAAAQHRAVQTPKQTAASAAPQSPEKASAPAVRLAPAVPPAEPKAEEESEHPPVDLNSIANLPGQGDSETGQNAPAPQGMADGQIGEGIEPLDLSGSLFDQPGAQDDGDSGGSEDDDGDGGDPEYRAARETVINIFGKLHVCNGWQAGRILDEQPAEIVDFCQRNSESAGGPKYTGPRTDQVAALMKLYPDAALKVQRAA